MNHRATGENTEKRAEHENHEEPAVRATGPAYRRRVSRLVPTGEVARLLGVSTRTVQAWVADGLLEPDLRTPGGHMRWDLDRLRRELDWRRVDGGEGSSADG